MSDVYTILVLTEDALTPHDVIRIAQLHGDEKVRAHVVVPVERHARGLVETLDEVALGRLGQPADASDPQLRAQAALDASVAELRAAGIEAAGQLSADNPVAEVVDAAASADEVIVVTQPHLVEESLRRDWASRVRDGSGKPVLHIVAGTDRVVS